MGRVVRKYHLSLSSPSIAPLLSSFCSLPSPGQRLMHFCITSYHFLTDALLSILTLSMPLILAFILPLPLFITCSVIRTGSLKLVHEPSERAPKFEYRAESNFFASMEMSDYGKMERSDDADQDRDRTRELERNLYSSGDFKTMSLS